MPHLKPRIRLDHTPPPLIDASRARYFITICCYLRGRNQLACPPVAEAVSEAVRHRSDQGLLFPYVLLLMPDHLHMIVGYNERLQSLSQVIGSLKQRLAQQTGIRWQKGFFDHRIGDESGYKEKIEYVLQNPVRKGLCERAEDWPYLWFGDMRNDLGAGRAT